MVGRKRAVASRSNRALRSRERNAEPDIYGQMLAEAGVTVQAPDSPERPLKRRRTGAQHQDNVQSSTKAPQQTGKASAGAQASGTDEEKEEEDDEELEFQDVALPKPTVQTMERDSDDDEDEEDEDIQFEDVELMTKLDESADKTPEAAELELNLTAQQSSTTPTRRAGERRKPMTKEEKERRVDIHRAHLLCLLSHVARRNHWCNDPTVQEHLRSHLTDKTVAYLNPGSHLPQFGQAESLKNGLKQAGDVWKTKFEIRERGLRRALWAEDAEQLQNYEPPSNMDSCLDRADFREAARKLQGSRDTGAQLYCALLRSAGVRARLVCSLQPLACVSGAPTLPKPKPKPKAPTTPTSSRSRDALANYKAMAEKTNTPPSPGGPTARRRLGHPNATAYSFKPAPARPASQRTFDVPVTIRESHYPVYWVEVLDTGHQKWQPVDAVVLRSFWKAKIFEPPITDKENSLCYVVAFEADGTAKDVTRRYAKAYTAKTRKLRVESVLENGDRWWRKVMKLFRGAGPSDLDQIENNELAGVEAREPMPRNVQDFKGHPVYALERHLRRNEVLVPGAMPSGTVGAGSRGPLEKIFRRKDVRVARSADKWYRLGREVKPNEIPAKWLPKKARGRNSRLGIPDEREEEEAQAEAAGTPIYTIDQTELYEPPPVRNGRVPKNKFGNVEVYVPSMIPRGAVHIVHEQATRAALIAGVDYAPALTGFQFKGRHGTAVLRGVVVAAEFEAAVRAVLDGLAALEREAADDRRRLAVLKTWRRLLMGLRIRERIWSGVDADERREAERRAEKQAGVGDDDEADEADDMDGASDATEEFDMVVDEEEEGGGGFLIE
ncbi:hypothetical protein CDD83_7443 [Cordyceps sp. RAO-2017]|nr:hypothetical protein CDD83_7443 [Cordyceps sp. RAO-2017]